MYKAKTFFLITLVLILASFFLANARAIETVDVAYILEDSSSVSSNVINTFSNLGLSYEIIKDASIPTTDFSKYSILFVSEDVTKKDLLPLKNKPSIFLDRSIADKVWTLSSSGQTVHRIIKVSNIHSFAFEGMTIPPNTELQIYSTTGAVHYIVYSSNSGISNSALALSNSRPLIAHSSKLVNGEMVKSLFFGTPEPDKWNSNGVKIFENSLKWIMAGTDQDDDGFLYSEDCNDNNETINPNATETPYDSIDQNCDGFDLLDVDNDGFCAKGKIISSSLFQCSFETGILGTDCNDNDLTINSNNPDLSLNCLNDAPELLFVPESLTLMETELVQFEVQASDPENDSLIFEINDARFTVDGNQFSWQTTYDDSGFYEFEVTVSDGDFSDSATLIVNITDLNRPPIGANIPDLEWDEDTTYTIYLTDYFEDLDSNNLEFAIEEQSTDGNIAISLEGDLVEFTSNEDFSGSGWVVFSSYDGNTKTISNTVNLNVLQVNDPLSFSGEIPSQEWMEDTQPDVAFNLNDYFSDIDSSLVFEAIGNSNIIVDINNGIVSFHSPADYAGTEEIYFQASDGEFTEISNTLSLTVYDQGEIPVFQALDCQTEIQEDEEYSCTLIAVDVENNDLTFKVASQQNINCEISGSVLTYKSTEDYNGPASCQIEVSDIHGKDSQTLDVLVSEVNDEPQIKSFSPNENIVSIIDGQNKKFSIEADDTDSELEIKWYINNIIYQDSSPLTDSKFNFQKGEGTYFLEARVYDGEFEVRKFWNVVVGPLSDFTCSEVSGNVCSADQICSGSPLSVKDAGEVVCCASTCIPKFEDADSCEVIDDKIEVKILNPESTEEIYLGSTEKVEFRISNDLGDDKNFDVELHLYNVNEDKSESDITTEVEIDEGDSRTLRLELPIPGDLDLNNKYMLFVSAKDDECSQAYSEINLQRPQDKVELSKFDLPEKAECGERVTAKLRVENLGTVDQNTKLELKSTTLNVDETYSYNLESYGDDGNRESEDFTFVIPESLQSGEYELKANTIYDVSKRESVSKKIEVTCIHDTYIESTIKPDTSVVGKITLNQVQGQQALSKTSQWNNPETLNVAFMMMLNLVLVASAGVLYFAHTRRTLRKSPGE